MTPVARQLPPGLHSAGRTAEFDEKSIPSALLKDHATREGSWALIHVESGRLKYCVTDERREPDEMILTAQSDPGIVAPTIRHHVEPIGAVRFHIEFFRAAD